MTERSIIKEKLINNIPGIIEQINEDKADDNKISLWNMAKDLGLTYAGIFRLAQREDLSTTPIGTLNIIANYLGVNITDLYIKVEDHEGAPELP